MSLVLSIAYCLLGIGCFVYVDQILDDYEQRTEKVLFTQAQKLQLFFVCVLMWWVVLIMVLWFEMEDEEAK